MTFGADCAQLRSKVGQALANKQWVAGVAGTAGMTGQERPFFSSTIRARY